MMYKEAKCEERVMVCTYHLIKMGTTWASKCNFQLTPTCDCHQWPKIGSWAVEGLGQNPVVTGAGWSSCLVAPSWDNFWQTCGDLLRIKMTLENPASCKQFHAFEVSLCKIWSWDNLIHHQFAYDEGHTDYICYYILYRWVSMPEEVSFRNAIVALTQFVPKIFGSLGDNFVIFVDIFSALKVSKPSEWSVDIIRASLTVCHSV